MKHLLCGYLLFSIFMVHGCSQEKQEVLPQVPTRGMVTMVDLGANSCIPCKMMAPILEELKREYEGKASIIFIDLSIHPGEIKKNRIRSLPTQIFYNEHGNEVYRHEGFLDKKRIVRVFKKLGVEVLE